jgi:hypothetical protein
MVDPDRMAPERPLRLEGAIEGRGDIEAVVAVAVVILDQLRDPHP